MEHFDVKSKIYSPPTNKGRLLSVIVNIAVVIMVICSIVSMLVSGPKVGNISGCIVAITVAALLKRVNLNEGHYLFCILAIDIDQTAIEIKYSSNPGWKTTIPIHSIISLEYSYKLECLRMICDYQSQRDGVVEPQKAAELLLYIAEHGNEGFYSFLTKCSNKIVQYVDRR